MAKKDSSKNKPDDKGGYRSTERDQFTVVLEDIRSQFRVFGEGLSYVSDTLDKHITHVATELEFVKEQLSIIRHNQVTRDEFQLLETRVARLEHTKKQ